MARLVKQGSAVLEVNLLAAQNTGQMKAQYPFRTGDFPKSAPAENGMLLVVDDVAGRVQRPAVNTDYVWLHYSVEKVYGEHAPELSNFNLYEGSGTLPRLYKLAIGDTFTTNAVELNAVSPAPGVFAYPGTDGYITLSALAVPTARVELRLVRVMTMPDGQVGHKFAVTRA